MAFFLLYRAINRRARRAARTVSGHRWQAKTRLTIRSEQRREQADRLCDRPCCTTCYGLARSSRINVESPQLGETLVHLSFQTGDCYPLDWTGTLGDPTILERSERSHTKAPRCYLRYAPNKSPGGVTIRTYSAGTNDIQGRVPRSRRCKGGLAYVEKEGLRHGPS